MRSRNESAVLAVEKRKLINATSSPGMTLFAPVPALMFDTWNEVGGKSALPSSQRSATSAARAGARTWIGFFAFSG